MKTYTLSGEWILVKEENREGAPEEWKAAIPSVPCHTVAVPHNYNQTKWKLDYAYSAVVSRYHGYVWYYRSFDKIPRIAKDERYRIEFDRVSYVCQVYLNGVYIGEHRHSEERFSFDVTDVIKTEGENLLAVRCFEPVNGGDEIDGIRLDQIPNGFWAGSETEENLSPIDSAGGILEEVRLVAVPELRIEEVYAKPDPWTGEVDLEITLVNDGNTPAELEAEVLFSELKRGNLVTRIKKRIVATEKTTVTLRGKIEGHKLWEPKDPTLYLAEVKLSNGAYKILRFGFKELCVKNGFFFLNGKRIFLKCAHGISNAETVIGMKNMGFHAFRSIQQVVPSEVLDLCDEIGFLIIESPLTAWGMRLHHNTQQMLEESLCNMVRMHRNHVCIGAYYLFNELHNTTILHMGKDCLPQLRALAPHSLFLLASGRWDKEYNVGSISNPGSYEWECAWGREGSADDCVHTYPTRFHASRNLGMGDLHPYVYIPMDAVARNWFRTVGEDGKPIFISECGIGTQENPMRRYFHLLNSGMSPQSESVKEIKKVWEDMEYFVSHYGMEQVYPFATDLCRASDRQNGRQRQMLFDLIRSNPMINGYSLTSWGTGNEGTLEGDGVIKETVAYAMQEGLSPLRWALFTDHRVIYENKPFTIEAVLCNEDVMKAGSYRAQAYVKGKEGVAWKREFEAVYPEKGYGNMPPLAATVLRETLSLPEGSYTFSVRLLEGACPFGGELRLEVAAPKRATKSEKSVATWGIAEKTEAVLRQHGIKTANLTGLDEKADTTVLVGCPENYTDTTAWQRLFALAEGGATVVFLNAELFAETETEKYLKMIAGEEAKCSSTIDWLYHFDTIHIPHPLFYGIHEEGMIDLECFSELYPRKNFLNTARADKTVAASLRVDCGNCAASLTVGEYHVGKGKMVLNNFRIEEALGENPYADQMLLNFAEHYGSSEKTCKI